MDSNNSSKAAILSTLIYSDIFDYPLTKKELWRYLHTSTRISLQEFELFLHKKGNGISKKEGFYTLSGREHVVERRQYVLLTNKEKIKKAKGVAKLLSHIPTICLIGISGSVAMESASEEDDIDLFFITKRHTVWLTRLFVTLLLDAKGLRRKRVESEVHNKICVNMFMDESHLGFSKEQQNLYIAHELLQLKPIFDRGAYYKKLLFVNRWGRNYLYNGFTFNTYPRSLHLPWPLLLFPLEILAHRVQEWYMKKHQKHEILTGTLLAFHPVSYEGSVLRKFRQKAKAYGL